MNCNSVRRKYLILLSCGFFCMSLVLLCQAEDKPQDIKAEFEKRVKAWGKYLMERPKISDLTGNKYYRDIISLGIPALPYMAEKIEKGCWDLGSGVLIITKKRFNEHEKEKYQVRDSISTGKAVVKWWLNARTETKEGFENLHVKWKEYKQKNKDKEAKDEYNRIVYLGIAALPYMADKVKAGDTDLIPAMSELTDGQLKKDATKEQAIDWWEKNKQNWLIPFPETKAENKPKTEKPITDPNDPNGK